MSGSEAVLARPPRHVSRVAFLGSPPEAARVLEALIASPVEVVQVVTQPDRRRGRGSATIATPVKEVAVEHGITVAHDLSSLQELAELGQVDLGVVVAYGRIIPRPLLERLPMVNLHYSLLPRWRGAAPVERAILAGDDRTGVCLMEVAEGLDTGAVHDRREVSIGPEESAADLRHRLTDVGVELLLSNLESGLADPVPQVGEATYAAKLERDEFRLDFDDEVRLVHARIRVGRAWTTFRDRRLGVERARPSETAPDGAGDESPGTVVGTSVRAGDGWLELLEVKPEGKRSMTAQEWVNGFQPRAGERLG